MFIAKTITSATEKLKIFNTADIAVRKLKILNGIILTMLLHSAETEK